jgi:hypothetical protein
LNTKRACSILAEVVQRHVIVELEAHDVVWGNVNKANGVFKKRTGDVFIRKIIIDSGDVFHTDSTHLNIKLEKIHGATLLIRACFIP